MEEQPPIWRVGANILNMQSRTADKRWSSGVGGLERCYQLLTLKTHLVTKHSYSKPRTWTNTLVQPKQRERDIRFGMWNVRNLCRAGSLAATARVIARYKLDLVGVQEVRWDKVGIVRAGD
jgi:hypothetical protein